MEISERILRLATQGGWIGVDLDGTMFTYDTWIGWNQFGQPIEPMVARVRAWTAAHVEVRIFTARVSYPLATQSRCRVTGQMFDGYMMRNEIQNLLERHGLPRLEVTCVKDVDMIELWDDRAVQVVPNTGRTLAEEHAAELSALRGKSFQEDRSAVDDFDPDCIPGN